MALLASIMRTLSHFFVCLCSASCVHSAIQYYLIAIISSRFYILMSEILLVFPSPSIPFSIFCLLLRISFCSIYTKSISTMSSFIPCSRDSGDSAPSSYSGKFLHPALFSLARYLQDHWRFLNAKGLSNCTLSICILPSLTIMVWRSTMQLGYEGNVRPTRWIMLSQSCIASVLKPIFLLLCVLCKLNTWPPYDMKFAHETNKLLRSIL